MRTHEAIITVRISRDHAEQLRKLAVEDDRKVAAVVRRMIRDGLSRQQTPVSAR